MFATFLLSVVNAFAGPSRATYQAKIVKPDGYPLEASSVNFKFTILDPAGTCILFSETYSNVNMNSTGGLVSFSLGSGVKTYPVSSPTFEDVFSNISSNLSCDAGGPPSYSPQSSDIRKIVMQFHDGSGWQTLPAMNINAVPYAMYATNAEKLGGVSATSFVQDSEIPTCPGGQALTYNGATFSCIVSGGGAVSAAAVTSALGYTPADSASLTTVTTNVNSVSSTVFSVSSTVNALSNSVTSLSNSVAVSFAAITSSQWVTSGTTISYNLGNVNVSGSLRISMDAGSCSSSSAGTLRYNGGLVEYCNGTIWSAFGVAGAGITNFNGSASGSQSLAVSLSGITPAFNSLNGVHTLNIPFASAATTTAGLISNSDYSLFSTVVSKITSSAAAIAQVLGYTPADSAVVTTLSSNLNSVSSTLNSAQSNIASVSASVATANSNIAAVSASLTTANTNIAAVSSSVNALSTNLNSVSSTLNSVQGNVASVSSSLNSLSNSTAASFASLVSSQWATSSTTLNYMTGNVGIGTVAPGYLLDVSGTVHANRFSANNGAFNNPSLTFVNNPGTGFFNNSGFLGISVNSSMVGMFNSGSLSFNAGGAGPQIYYSGGNAAQPSYAFNVDSDTGMFNPNAGGGSNELGFSTAGVERVRFTSSGAVGIATTTPSKSLHVASGGVMTGSVSGFPAEYLQVHNEFNSGSLIKWDALAGNSVNAGVYSLVSPTASSSKSNHSFVNILFMDIPAGASATGTNNSMYNFTVRNRYAANTDNGYVSSMVGYRNEYGHQSGVPGNTPTTNAIYGAVFAPQVLTGTVNNLTDLYLGAVVGGGTLGQHYSVYQESVTAKNYFGAKTGFGQITPNALVHLGSGSTTVAPLKFTSGPLTASPASGALEYDGFNYYITDGSNTRRAIATVGGPGASADFTGNVTTAASFIASGNIAASGSLISPTIVGGSGANGNLIIDSTSHATKGKITIAPSGGNVGIGTSSPVATLHVSINNASTALSGVTDGFFLQNRNATVGALTPISFVNQDGYATAQIAGTQNTGNVGSQLTLATKTSGGSWNTSQLVLTTTNRVGVGTAVPSARLEVTPANDTSTAFYVGDSTTNGVTGLYFSRWGSASAPMGIQGTVAGVGANTLVLQGQSGNVGIGTASATEKLTVYDGSVHIPYVANKTHGYSLDLGNNKAYIWRNYQYADDSVYFSQNWYANDAGVDVIPNNVHTTQAIEMRRNVGVMLKTGTSNTVPSARLTVDPNGNVGIGTTTPGARLHIPSPSIAGNNNRLVTGNSNSDLMDATAQNGGDVYLDHIVSARLTATASTTIVRAATLKIDQAPTATSGATITNPYALWIQSGNSVFGGNLGIGVVSSPSSYGHGGTNKFIEIYNSSGAINAQSHLVLSSGVSDVMTSSLGTITWAQPNVSTSRKEVAWIGSITDSANPAAPAAYLNISTRSASDATPIERMRVTATGNVGVGTTNPQSLLQLASASQATERIRLSGQEFYQSSNTDTEGLSMLLGVNRTGNRQLWIADSANLTQNSTNKVVRISPSSGDVSVIATDGVTTKPLLLNANGGGVAIGTASPATGNTLTNISSGAVNTNVGDSTGVGQNSQSLGWSANSAGYAMAISNTYNAGSGNGLQVRTISTHSNTNIFTAGIGVSSTANTADILTVKPNYRVNVNGTLALQPNISDHIYMEFYARTATPNTRSGWLGFGAAATNLMSMTNETGGHMNFGTTGAGKVGVNQPNPSYMLDVAGTMRGFGITDSSDIRLKKDIYALDRSLEKILQVKGVTYYWKNEKITEKKQIGFIAQQLEKIFPELVETDKQGMKSVNYSHLVSPLVEAVKSLYAKITNVEAKQEVQARELASVKDENEKLKQKNQELEKRLERLERALNKN